MSTLLFKIENLINKSNSSLEFKCHICTSDEQLFDDEDDLKEHLLKVHNKNDKLFACLFCGKEFRKLNFFCSHLRQLHKEEIASTQMITPLTLDLNTDTLDWSKLIDLKLNDTTFESKSNEIDVEDSNSVDSSSALSSSDKPDKNDDDDDAKLDMNEKEDFDTAKHKPHHNKHHNNKHHIVKMSNGFKSHSSGSAKTWTCQMCKKQFDQRVELSKHQCIELNLKLLKKKKEIRKKKWREAHWKRKIDLSYIETTTLTQLSQNIADNLSFCIDGTNEDLRAYSREVKDYLNTELGSETQVQMFLKCCFPDVLKKIQPVHNQFLDTNLLSKSNSYFIDSVYAPNKPHDNNNHKSKGIILNHNSNLLVFNCKNCKFKSRCMPELIQHQREVHNLVFKTTFDCFNYNSDTKVEKESSDECVNWSSSYNNATSPVGYFGCDPFAYVFNLHWDQTLQMKCSHCGNTFSRPKYAKHALVCQTSDSNNHSDEIEATRRRSCFSEETNSNRELVHIENDLNESFKCDEETDLDACKQVVERMIAQIESVQTDVEMREECKLECLPKQSNTLRISSRSRRSNQKKIENKNLIDKFLSQNPSYHPASSDEDVEYAVATSSRKAANKPTGHVLETFSSANNRKMYECEKCGLEFTSSNSVIRHQEKSCLRVKVISLKTSKAKDSLAKKCPICAATFFNTHRVSIHIYKHHRNLLGSASLPPSSEAKHLNELQMKKLSSSKPSSNDLDEIDESEEK